MPEGMLIAQADLAESCGIDPGLICRLVFEWTDSATWAKVAEVLIAKPLKIVLILVLAWLINRLVRRATSRVVTGLIESREQRAAEREQAEVADGRFDGLTHRLEAKLSMLRQQQVRGRQRAEALGAVLRSTASFTIYSLAIIIALAEFEINLGPLIAGAGIVGIALGFGAQKLVQDFLSGIFMLIEDQFGVGDVIDVGEASGVVEAVTLRTTKLRDVEGTVWWVPNGEIRRVGNKSQQWARSVMDVEVAYDTDMNKAMEVIKRVADEVWHEQLENATVLEEPQIWGVERFGESAVVIRLVLKTEPGEQWATSREVRARLKAAFDAEGIEIPFPQRTVWVKSAEGDRSHPDRSTTGPAFHAQTAPEDTGED